MKRRAFRVLSFTIIALALVGLACGRSNPIQESSKVISTAAVLASTVEAGVTALAPTLEAAATALAPTLQAAATEVAPTLEAAATQVVDLAATAVAAATQLVPTAEAAATALPAVPIATPEGGIEEFLGLASGSEGLSGLDSFRLTAVLDFAGGGQTGKVEFSGEFTVEPQATHGQVTLSGVAAAGLPLPTFEYVVIEGEGWVKIGRQPWLPVEGPIEQFVGQQPYAADDFMPFLPQAQRVLPDQTVNGIVCKHYVYQATDVQLESGTLSQAEGEVFTALDGGYVVRYTLHGEGNWDQHFAGQTGTINLVYNVLDVDSGIVVEPPR